MTTQLFGLITLADARRGIAFLEAVGFRPVALHWADDAETVLANGELAWGRHGALMANSVERDSTFSRASDVGRGRYYCVVDRDADVDAAYTRALAAGATSLAPPIDQDYGGRGASVNDPEGNEFSFGSYAGALGPSALRPKLVVSDADTAIDFYTEAFGATLDARYAHRGQVVFAQLSLLGRALEVQVKDADAADPVADVPGLIIEITVPDPDPVWARAVAAGAEVRFELADRPYGARQGRLIDPFGHQWLISGPQTLTPEAIQAALDGG
ncbi:MAG: VOC family protein [Acidimicrobiales bacterium]